ncbi:hypothetical protein ABU614_10235 [Lysobacter firmicutimachus]|uniref:Tetratricopeptide repeat protein n=1 Tax=Lysobacter firmicutimachus TaxID=1792846 RepID=A0AAU8N0M1_9GAMM
MKAFIAVAAAALFVIGTGPGHAVKKPRPTPMLYQGKANEDAAKALLEVALIQSGKNGSWERIGAGRVYYLGGLKTEGQAVFDAILSGEHEDSDVYRIARVYAEAGEWTKAKPLFDKFLAGNRDDAKALAEVGAHYLMQGDRLTAERMFAQAFELADDDPWITEHVAGAYLGVKTQE